MSSHIMSRPQVTPLNTPATLEAVDDETWEATVHKPSKEIMDQWGFGVGGPETMPKPMPDAGLFKEVGI